MCRSCWTPCPASLGALANTGFDGQPCWLKCMRTVSLFKRSSSEKATFFLKYGMEGTYTLDWRDCATLVNSPTIQPLPDTQKWRSTLSTETWTVPTARMISVRSKDTKRSMQAMRLRRREHASEDDCISTETMHVCRKPVTAEGKCSAGLLKRGLSPQHQRTVHRQCLGWQSALQTTFDGSAGNSAKTQFSSSFLASARKPPRVC